MVAIWLDLSPFSVSQCRKRREERGGDDGAYREQHRR